MPLYWEKCGEFKFEKMQENIYVIPRLVTELSKENEGLVNNPVAIEGRNGLIMAEPEMKMYVSGERSDVYSPASWMASACACAISGSITSCRFPLFMTSSRA